MEAKLYVMKSSFFPSKNQELRLAVVENVSKRLKNCSPRKQPTLRDATTGFPLK